MNIEFIESIAEIDRDQWQALWQTDYPFVQYDFLLALEASGSVCKATGWKPQHLLAYQDGQLLAAMPLYQKDHSYGEYVFDWAWADAYQRYGLDYYPKLINAIPFTPASGPRMALASNVEPLQATAELSRVLKLRAQAMGLSSVHMLFPNVEQQNLMDGTDWVYRRACQFHWFNRGYQNFDDFLQTFNSRKRKSLNRERRKVVESGVELVRVEGANVTAEQWHDFYVFYHMTYLKRSGRQGYLSQEFFHRLAEGCADSLMMVQAYHQGTMVAAALFFKDKETLYGRYWGCREEFDLLHFEACYYQGLEYAIERGLQKFDPGAQGEHKIQRGFEPTEVGSYHYVAEAAFAPSISQFVQEEAEHMALYQQQMQEQLPFKVED